MQQAKQERRIRYARARILDTLLGGKSGKIISADCLLCDNLLFLSSKLCIGRDNPGVRIVEIFDGQPESENLENLTIELIKHRTTVYRKYMRN